MLIGHQKIISFFDKAEKDGKLSHAYGFIGPSEIGKRKAAMQIAARLLKFPEEKLAGHPDFFYLERIEEEKTGKLKKDITVAQARELRSKLQTTGWSQGFRVIIINEAELLNTESANALLKTLEEPGKGCIFFLLIENEGALLPTIRSRIQPFYFSMVKTKEIEEGLVSMGVDAEKAEVFARRSLGKPGAAIKFLGAEFETDYTEKMKVFKEMLGAPFYKKLQLIEEYFGDKEDGQRGRQEWKKIIDLWIFWFRDLLLKRNGSPEYAGEPGISSKVSFSSRELLELIDTLFELKKLLSQNIHPRLAVETGILKF